jgi:hypothetical protein
MTEELKNKEILQAVNDLIFLEKSIELIYKNSGLIILKIRRGELITLKNYIKKIKHNLRDYLKGLEGE